MLEHTIFGDAPGTPVLIAHGLYGSGRNWGVIAKRLSEHRRVITVDMRNHGHSHWSNDHTYPAMADDLAQVIDHIGTPMDVVGHSMGGKAAMMLALSRPDALRSLIVVDIAPVGYSHSQMQFIDAMRAVDLTHVTRRSQANDQLTALGVEATLCSFLTQSLDVAEKRWRLNLDALARNMPAILDFPEVTGTFNGPTLFLSGATSDYVDRAYRPKILSLFPKAKFAKIPGAGHWLHAEKPREFEQNVSSYLNTFSGQDLT